MKPALSVLIATAMICAISPTFAESPANAAGAGQCNSGACTLSYPAEFFSRYAPVTALDMIRNLPGFVLDDGEDRRGFGGAAGNLLIDGERISAKSESPSDLLGRIPAANVDRIEVIRGSGAGTDLRGQALIANVVRRKGAGGSATWTVAAANRPTSDQVQPFVAGSASAELAGAQVNLGLELGEFLSIREAEELVRDASEQLLEPREERSRFDGNFYNVSLQARRPIAGTRLGLNLLAKGFTQDGGEQSERAPLAGPAFSLFQQDDAEEDIIEIGFDAERAHNDTVTSKLIGLHRRTEFIADEGLIRNGTVQTQSGFASTNEESIARLEIDYAGLEGHLLEFAVEGALNTLESRFSLAQLNQGVLAPVNVPGGQTDVEERRVDLSLSDSLSFGKLTVDALMAGELSRIEQQGGFSAARDFAFLKPTLTFTYAANEQLQLRARVLRDIGQLNFFDFVSTADLGDVELALGNPSLEPEVTNTIDGTVEWRPGGITSVSLTVFADRIEDVIDVLPLTGNQETTGNIGDGERAGVRAEITLPLDGLRLPSARLDVRGRWQTSDVSDPLTGSNRRLSEEEGWESSVSLRQDLARAGFAWGVTLEAEDREAAFGLDELDEQLTRPDIEAFVEYRRGRLRFRLAGENLLRGGRRRDRRVFDGSRAANLLSFRETRLRRPAREIFVRVSGTLGG